MRRPSLSSLLTAVLSVAWYFVAVALVLTACLAALSVFHDFGGTSELDIPVSFNVDASALQLGAPSLGVESAHLRNVRGSLIFPAPAAAPLVAPMLAGLAIILAVTLWALGQLIAVFRTLRDGQPFVRANAIRIRRLGFVVIAGEVVRAVLIFAANSYAMSHFSAIGLRFDARPDLNLFAIVHGLIILAIAEVFRAGTRLDEEQSLTI